MYLYRFVACFQSGSCDEPHLWGQAVHAKTYKEAKAKVIAELQKDDRVVFEIMDVTNGIGAVEEVQHQGVTCCQCQFTIDQEDDGASSCCGSVHTACLKPHIRNCPVCSAGIL